MEEGVYFLSLSHGGNSSPNMTAMWSTNLDKLIT